MQLEELFSQLPPDEVHAILTDPLIWAETLLITPTTEDAFEANFVQRKILGSKKRFNVIRVHRRAGKSYALSILALFYALTDKNVEVLVVCPGGAQVSNVFDTIRSFIAANSWMQPYKDEDHKNLPQVISFKNGSKIKGFTTAARSKGAGMTIRGQGGDIILVDEGAYLNEMDWATLDPIMVGDIHRRRKTRVFIASTPAYTRGKYYEMCMSAEQSENKIWNQIFVPITKNPSVSEEFIAECRATCTNELDWTKEYLAEFPEIGEGVFPKHLVDRSQRHFTYQAMLDVALAQHRRREKPPTRTIGVDWDKFNKDGHGPNIVVLEAISSSKYRLIYKEEIEQSKYSLTNAVNRVIELNDIFQPEWIFIDRGYGDMQLEELQKYGKLHPGTKLHKRVVGVQFAENVDCPLPGGGLEKKRFKQAMISVLRTWFERDQLELSSADGNLNKELIEYHVVSQTDSNIKYSDENDHAIAALGLAAMAMHQKVKNPYAPEVAHRVYRVEAPVPVPSRVVRKYAGSGRQGLGQMIRDMEDDGRSFSRASLGDFLPSSRSNF